VNRKTDERAATRRRTDEERERLRELETTLGLVANGVRTAAAQGAYRKLRSVTADVGDPVLMDAVGRMLTSPGGLGPWKDAHGDAQHRVGELLRRLRES